MSLDKSMFSLNGRNRRRATTGNPSATPPHTPPPGTPAANVSDSDYAARCRLLLGLHKDLVSLGAQMFFDLPKITVIGSQSAGKSSLIEAVSGIAVPRDSGTCTRCPMEVSMSSAADSWSCNIWLRQEYDRNGDHLTASDRIQFGSTITDKRQVEIWLRRAQAAVLSPHRPPQDFFNKSAQEILDLIKNDRGMLPFSQNIVEVELNDPDATDLSFVDLPGLIHNADEALISLVKDLVVKNIEGQNTLILVTVPMSDDMENQQAMLLARQKDQSGSRTIGVLTKPDTLTAGSTGQLDRWRNILLGHAHQLNHGYYCVKLPDDAQRGRGITRDEAQQLADEFFSATSPWREMTDRRRFGIPNFVADISRHLVRLIEANLPFLREQVSKLLDDDRSELAQLPSPPSGDAFTEIMLALTALGRSVHEAVMGNTEDYKRLVQTNREHYNSFKLAIRATCLDFRPFETPRPDPQLRTIDELLPAGNHTTVAIPSNAEVLHLSDVRQVIKDSITWELPGHVPFEATKVLVQRMTKKWPAPAMTCFEHVYRTTSSIVQELVSKQFSQFRKLENLVLTVVNKELKDSKEKAFDVVRMFVELEETVPLYTQNDHYYRDCSDRWHQRYHDTKHGARYECSADPWEKELRLMGDVRGYFQVAYKRIIDYLPLVIEHQLNQAFANNLPQRLFESISSFEGGSRDQRLRDLLSEDEEIADNRRRLQDRVARLEVIQETLSRV